MRIWSRFWKRSKKPGKQRKYRYSAPSHVRRKLMSTHLSKDLIKKHKKRSYPVRKGDLVIIMKGEFRGRKGKVERVDTRKERVYVEKVSLQKKDGTNVSVGIHPSNIMITKLQTGDSKRFGRSSK